MRSPKHVALLVTEVMDMQMIKLFMPYNVHMRNNVSFVMDFIVNMGDLHGRARVCLNGVCTFQLLPSVPSSV